MSMIILPIDITLANEWYTDLIVSTNATRATISFKIDTGCNALILSHATLKRLGISTTSTEFLNRRKTTATTASGTTMALLTLGTASLYDIDKHHIGEFPVYSHATRQTHDLLGTSVMSAYSEVTFNLRDNTSMILKA